MLANEISNREHSSLLHKRMAFNELSESILSAR